MEKNQACRAVLQQHYPDTCLMEDVMDMLKKAPKTKTWRPQKLELAPTFNCRTHGKQPLGVSINCVNCCLPRCHVLKSVKDVAAIIGAPCISHSKSLDWGIVVANAAEDGKEGWLCH